MFLFRKLLWRLLGFNYQMMLNKTDFVLLKNDNYCQKGIRTYDNGAKVYRWTNAPLKIGKYCSIAHNVNFIVDEGFHKMPSITNFPIANNLFNKENSINGMDKDLFFSRFEQKEGIAIGNDVWIGMGAFIPSHANEVYLNKQGDCKDLSNFLSEALKYKGIDSDIALAATFDHISDCDFPSLSSANHVICVAYLNGEKILLDPTDPIHLEGTPVQSLQDRTILIVNSEGGSFYKVKRFSPQQNEIFYQLDLKIDSNNMLIKGTFDIDYRGISGNYLRRYLKNTSKKEFENFGKLYYEKVFGNQSVSNLITSNELKKLHFKGNISINGKTFNDGLNKYLFIDYLPRLLETESRETLIEGTYLRNPFHKKVRVKIKMDEPIETFDAIEHTYEGEGMSLNVKIRAISNLEIECNYDFIFNHIFIEKENIDKTNEILKSFKKIINEPIILKKKKS